MARTGSFLLTVSPFHHHIQTSPASYSMDITDLSPGMQSSENKASHSFLWLWHDMEAQKTLYLTVTFILYFSF
jgi:hypothetical protein